MNHIVGIHPWASFEEIAITFEDEAAKALLKIWPLRHTASECTTWFTNNVLLLKDLVLTQSKWRKRESKGKCKLAEQWRLSRLSWPLLSVCCQQHLDTQCSQICRSLVGFQHDSENIDWSWKKLHEEDGMVWSSSKVHGDDCQPQCWHWTSCQKNSGYAVQDVGIISARIRSRFEVKAF